LAKLSIIIPVLNEATVIEEQLRGLQPFRDGDVELIVADGGSEDHTAKLAEYLADRVVVSKPGRAHQMNRGSQVAKGEVFLFLHVDTALSCDAFLELQKVLARGHFSWGWFDVRLSNTGRAYRIIGAFMNIRARLTGVCTGDQSLIVSRQLFERLRGFPEISLMEDIAISKLLRQVAKPWICDKHVIVSARRWEQRGLVRTILLMWKLRFLYFLGVSTDRLAALYH